MLDTCVQLNTSEMKLLQFLREEVVLQGSEVTPSKSKYMDEYIRVALKKGYSHLSKMGILKRVRRGVYKVNAELFPPAVKVPYVPATKAVLAKFQDNPEDVVSVHTGDAREYLDSIGVE